jgi:hypothetical protein
MIWFIGTSLQLQVNYTSSHIERVCLTNLHEESRTDVNLSATTVPFPASESAVLSLIPSHQFLYINTFIRIL